MTHTLAMEWAQYGIRVNSVSPGLVKTAMTYWVPQQPDWEQQLKYYGGFPRLAEVQELGGAYVYLLSDAASYTTSIDIPVNGVIGSECLMILSKSLDDTDTNSLLKCIFHGEVSFCGCRVNELVYLEEHSWSTSIQAEFLHISRISLDYQIDETMKRFTGRAKWVVKCCVACVAQSF